MADKPGNRLNPWKIQGYKPGQNVIAKIMKAEPGGYSVLIVKDSLPGYLPSNARHNSGDDVLATFVCIDKNRMLLSERFTHGKGDLVKKDYGGVNWEDHLNDSNYNTAAQQAVPDSDQFSTAAQQYSPEQYANEQSTSGQYGAQQGTPDQYGAPDQYGGAPPNQYGAPPQNQNPYGAPQDQYGAPQAQDPYGAQAQQDPYGAQAQQDPNGWQQQQQPQSFEQQNQQYTQQQQNQFSSGGNPAQQYATGPLPAQNAPSNNQQYMTGPLPAQNSQMPQQFQPQEFLAPVAAQHQADPSQFLTGAQPAQRYAEGVPTRRFQLRRAIDLIMPPIDQESLSSMRIGDYDVEWLITQLEGGMKTGCVKAACESRLSRAAMLLYRGRAVGCIYGCKSDPTTKPTEESLQAMLSDLESPDTVVTIYDLPEEITLAMSSLFLGYPVERHDDYSAKEYLDYICNWLGQKNGTATLAISLTEDRGTCLGYIYKGEFSGAFYVEDQAYRADRAFVDEMLGNDPRAALEVSILPPEMHASAVRFGFSLSMARTRKMD